jgi:hypothetical protein
MDALFGDEPIEDDLDDDGADDDDDEDDGVGSGSESSLPTVHKASAGGRKPRASSGIFARIGESIGGVFGNKKATGARGEYNAVDEEQ